MESNSAIQYQKSNLAWINWGWFLLCLCFFSPVSAFIGVPKLEAPVTDLTGTLTPDQVQALETKIRDFEAKKGSQIVVLIVPTTEPEDIAEFAIKVFDLNLIGRKGIDDGVILIVAKNDRKFRIEVGYGLEGVVSDAISKRITSEIIKPYFKNDDYVGGINAGVDQLIKLIEGEPLPEPTKRDADQGGDEGSFLFVLFAGLFIGSVLSSLFGRVIGALMAGIGSSLVASAFIGFGGGAILVGLMVFFLLSARFGGGGGWSNGGYGGHYGGGRGWSGGGSWGGGSSWGGGGGHGGGGGASDSW